MSWDRILVMEAGEVGVSAVFRPGREAASLSHQEFDTPIALYDRGGLFRGMCERSGISRAELVKAHAFVRGD